MDTLLYPLTLATMVMTILAIFASLVYGNVSPFLTLGCLDNDTEEEREGYSRTQGVSNSENARLGGEDMHVQQQHHVQPAHMDKTNDEDGCAKLSLNRRQDTKLSIRLSLARSGTQWHGDAQDMHTGNGQTVQQHVDADIKLLCDVSDEEDGTANQATDLMQPNTTSSDAPPSPSPSDTTKCSQESSHSHPPSTWSPMAMFLSAFGDMSDDNQLTSQQGSHIFYDDSFPFLLHIFPPSLQAIWCRYCILSGLRLRISMCICICTRCVSSCSITQCSPRSRALATLRRNVMLFWKRFL